jgi:hypothetical protein
MHGHRAWVQIVEAGAGPQQIVVLRLVVGTWGTIWRRAKA